MSAIGNLKKTKKAVSVASVFKELGAIKYVSASVLGLTAIISAIGFVQQKYKELDQNTQQAFSSWSNSNITFNSQIEEITKLKSALDEGTLSEQEAYNAKSQLFDIQQSLVDSYGNQASGIDLVNGKLEDQISLMNSLSRAEANRLINENINGYNRAVSKMEKERMLEIGSIPNFMKDSAEGRALQEVLDKYKDSIVSKRGLDGIEMFFAKGNAEEVYETINNFMNDVRDLSKKFDGYAGEGLFDSFLNTSEYSLSKAKDVLETYKMTYEEAKKANLIADKELYQTAVGAERIDGPNGTAIFKFKNQTALDWMNDARNAVEEYNDALLSGDTSRIEEAATSFETVKNQVDYLLENTGMSEHKSVFDDIFGQINSGLAAQKKLEKELASGTLKKHGEILKASGLTALELKQAFNTEGLQDGETQLNAIIDLADELGYISKDSADDVYRLIDKLAELGYVAGGSVSTASKSIASIQSSVKTAIETQNNLTAALAAGNTATGMNAEQMQNVIEAFKEIKDFDMATLFEETATGIQMNTEAFKEYNEKLQLKEQAALMDAIIAKTEEYNAALKSQNADEISRTRDELIKLQLMLSEYEASVSKYNAYITATSSANPRDSYSNIVTGYKSVGELIKQGWVTDDSVISYLKLVRGDNWNVDETTGKILSTKEAYDKLSETIEGTSSSLKDYLTTDSKGNLTSEGVWRFVEDAVNLGFGERGEDGLLSLDLTGGKLEQLAKRFGTTTDVIELFGKALSDAGMNVTFEPIAKQIENIDKKAADLKEQIKNATDENEALKLMEELNSVESKQIRLRINAALNDGGKSISELLSLSDADLVTELKIDDSQVTQARQMLEDLGRTTGEIPLNVKIDEGQLQAILGSLTGQVTVEPEVSSPPDVPDATVDTTAVVKDAPKVPNATVNVAYGGSSGKTGISAPGNVNVSGKLNLRLGSYPRTAPSITGTANYTGKFPTSAPTVYGTAVYTAKVTNPPSGGGAITVSTGTMTSVARTDGTAYNVLNYKRLSPSHAGGKVALDTDEYALTNEIGRESIVRDGVWYMLPPGPHMEHLRKGDIVFSAKQTEELLKAGRTSTYAKALSAGTINALANGSIHAYSGYTGSGYNPWASAGGGYKGNSASTIGSGASSSGGGGSNTSSKDDEHKIDWIEIAIKRFEALLKKLASIAENTFNNLITRLDATTENIVSTSKDIDLQGKAYDRYIKEANSIGLSAGIAEKIRNGEIDINSYDESTRKKIDEYKKWYEKADDCATAIEELKTQLGELYKNKFDYIQKDYENRLELMQEQAKSLDSELKRLETQGYKADASIYEEQAKDRAKRVEIMKSQLADMQKAFDDLNASGFLQEGSEAWYEMMLEIQKVKNEIDDTDIEIIQLNNSIRQLKWDSFDSALSLISDLNDEASFLIDLLKSDKMTDDVGNLTDDAIATLGMHAQRLDTFIGKSQRYAEEIARLDGEISKDPMNQTLIDRRKELLKLQRESILAAKDEKTAMKDLISEGFDAQLESLKKLIDAYSDSLDSAKDLYDFQKSISEKSNTLSEIEKQLAAYSGDNSQEARATIQKLKSDLEKASSDLQDAEYNRMVSDTKKMLDSLYDEYERVLNSQLDNIDELVEELIGTVNSNAESILNTIQEAVDKVGIGLSGELTEIWGGNTDWDTISANSDLMTEKMSSVLDAVNAIYRNTCLLSGETAAKSFASGGLVDYTGKANVHGTKSKPELMLNAGDTKNFLELRDLLRKTPHIDLAMRSRPARIDTGVTQIASTIGSTGNSGCTFGDIRIEIDHVENYDDFVRQLQHDKKFEGMIQSMTIGRLGGKNSLDKYSYSWKG